MRFNSQASSILAMTCDASPQNLGKCSYIDVIKIGFIVIVGLERITMTPSYFHLIPGIKITINNTSMAQKTSGCAELAYLLNDARPFLR